MKFAYIGQKADGERAFMERTGIEWMPGSEHDVTDAEAAAEMVKHPTIWKQLEGGSVPVAGEVKAQYPRAGTVTDEDVDEEMDRQEKERQAKAAEPVKVEPAQAKQEEAKADEPAKPAKPAKKPAKKK